MTTRNEQAPGDIEALLPWYAAGTLSPAESARVDAALSTDDELARRFALVQEELAETIHLNESLGAPSARAMEKLFAAIEAEPARKIAPAFRLAGWLSSFAGSLQPRTLAFAGAAAAFLVLLQAGVITGLVLNRGVGASGPGLASSGDTTAAGLAVLVQFSPQATAADITRLLDTYKAIVVDGPRGGLFRVRLTEAKSKEDLAPIVARMQNERAVGFVAPAN